MDRNSLGILEVVGTVAAVEALDAITKASNVRFKTMEAKLGGRLVTLVFEGKTDDVKEAVEIGATVANKITKCVAKAVILKPHEEVIQLLEKSSLKFKRA